MGLFIRMPFPPCKQSRSPQDERDPRLRTVFDNFESRPQLIAKSMVYARLTRTKGEQMGLFIRMPF
jgi:hypothetical protein